jgi:hypothetical protein
MIGVGTSLRRGGATAPVSRLSALQVYEAWVNDNISYYGAPPDAPTWVIPEGRLNAFTVWDDTVVTT